MTIDRLANLENRVQDLESGVFWSIPGAILGGLGGLCVPMKSEFRSKYWSELVIVGAAVGAVSTGLSNYFLERWKSRQVREERAR